MLFLMGVKKVEGNRNREYIKGGAKMDNIEKALQNLVKAVKSNETVERVTVTITF